VPTPVGHPAWTHGTQEGAETGAGVSEVRQDEGLRGERLPGLGKLTISSDRDGDKHTIRPLGELDLATADELQHELERAEASNAQSIVLDLSGLTFMDSTGVQLLLRAHARSRADANRLMLLRGPAAVQRVLELTGVAALLPFSD
jgi:anti-anti-sigma factor